MATGVIKFFKADKGFGFIKPDEDGEDVFVHVSELPGQQPLHEGMRVGYDEVHDRAKNKTRAANIRLL